MIKQGKWKDILNNTNNKFYLKGLKRIFAKYKEKE